MKLIVQENFNWAHRGVEIEQFEAGAEFETDDEDLIEVSTNEGWTKPADGETVPTTRARVKK
jgi:hypothetical protein